ncbi:MAG: hypothetical protein LBN34_08955 [Clostridiales Family XIII bacterium]|jgi:hypothetical protein|nr:hypothetical protein [Clostridiales Family XIII bacterium]
MKRLVNITVVIVLLLSMSGCSTVDVPISKELQGKYWLHSLAEDNDFYTEAEIKLLDDPNYIRFKDDNHATLAIWDNFYEATYKFDGEAFTLFIDEEEFLIGKVEGNNLVVHPVDDSATIYTYVKEA